MLCHVRRNVVLRRRLRMMVRHRWLLVWLRRWRCSAGRSSRDRCRLGMWWHGVSTRVIGMCQRRRLRWSHDRWLMGHRLLWSSSADVLADRWSASWWWRSRVDGGQRWIKSVGNRRLDDCGNCSLRRCWSNGRNCWSCREWCFFRNLERRCNRRWCLINLFFHVH